MKLQDTSWEIVLLTLPRSSDYTRHFSDSDDNSDTESDTQSESGDFIVEPDEPPPSTLPGGFTSLRLCFFYSDTWLCVIEKQRASVFGQTEIRPTRNITENKS